MDEECESRDIHSDDDNSPTDTSEDSVEVKVSRIIVPALHSRSNIHPFDGRKRHSSGASTNFPPVDFSTHRLKSVSCRPGTGHGSDGLAGAPSGQQQCPLGHGKDKKYSRRKASDPRRLVTGDEKPTKRCFELQLDHSPPPKLQRYAAVKAFPDDAGPSTSYRTGGPHSPALPAAFFHPMIGYPDVRLGGNVLFPHLNLLRHLPYAVVPTVSSASSAPVDPSRLPTTTPKMKSDNQDSRRSKVNNGEAICANVTAITATDLSVKKPPPQLHSITMSKHSPPPAVSITAPQEDPIDYSIRKLVLPAGYSSGTQCMTATVAGDDLSDADQAGGSRRQRNYKNMTRERRIEANARERTRVHTISAAFEKLRQCVPSYSNNQKLSKLCVLRIACAYILSLSRLAGVDYSEEDDDEQPSFAECVDLTTRTIQTEGRTKNRRQD